MDGAGNGEVVFLGEGGGAGGFCLNSISKMNKFGQILPQPIALMWNIPNEKGLLWEYLH